jgi:hypothetical protein
MKTIISKNALKMSVLLAIASSAFVATAYAQPNPTPKRSAESSASSATAASRPAGDVRGVLASCAAAADELAAIRELSREQELENAALRQRLSTEERYSSLLLELDSTRKAETQALREALEARRAESAAKDAVIAAQQKLIDELRRRKRSPLAIVRDVLTGLGAGLLIK